MQKKPLALFPPVADYFGSPGIHLHELCPVIGGVFGRSEEEEAFDPRETADAETRAGRAKFASETSARKAVWERNTMRFADSEQLANVVNVAIFLSETGKCAHVKPASASAYPRTKSKDCPPRVAYVCEIVTQSPQRARCVLTNTFSETIVLAPKKQRYLIRI